MSIDAPVPQPTMPPPPPMQYQPTPYQPGAPMQYQPNGVPMQYGNQSGLPAGVDYVSGLGRLGGYLLEALLITVTLGIGWLIWAAMLAGEGQTPAKKLLGRRVISSTTFQPVGFGTMLFMRGIVAGFVAQFAIVFTLGVLLFMPFWDSRNQNLWDKVSGTLVVSDPNNAWRRS